MTEAALQRRVRQWVQGPVHRFLLVCPPGFERETQREYRDQGLGDPEVLDPGDPRLFRETSGRMEGLPGPGHCEPGPGRGRLGAGRRPGELLPARPGGPLGGVAASRGPVADPGDHPLGPGLRRRVPGTGHPGCGGAALLGMPGTTAAVDGGGGGRGSGAGPGRGAGRRGGPGQSGPWERDEHRGAPGWPRSACGVLMQGLSVSPRVYRLCPSRWAQPPQARPFRASPGRRGPAPERREASLPDRHPLERAPHRSVLSGRTFSPPAGILASKKELTRPRPLGSIGSEVRFWG